MATERKRPVISDGLPSQLPDIDPEETTEWIESFDGVIDERGAKRARYIMLRLLERARYAMVRESPGSGPRVAVARVRHGRRIFLGAGALRVLGR